MQTDQQKYEKNGSQGLAQTIDWVVVLVITYLGSSLWHGSFDFSEWFVSEESGIFGFGVFAAITVISLVLVALPVLIFSKTIGMRITSSRVATVTGARVNIFQALVWWFVYSGEWIFNERIRNAIGLEFQTIVSPAVRRRGQVRVTYDDDAQAAYLYFAENRTTVHGYTAPCESAELFPDLIVDFDNDNRLMGIEHLSPSSGLHSDLFGPGSSDIVIDPIVEYSQASDHMSVMFTSRFNKDYSKTSYCEDGEGSPQIEYLLNLDSALVGIGVPNASRHLPIAFFDQHSVR